MAKLGLMLVNKVSNPLARLIAARADKSPLFRNWVCVPPANLFHWCEIQLKLRMMNVGSRATKVPKLSEAKAIEQSSAILAEFVIFFVGSSVIVNEFNRSAKKEEEKEEQLEQDELALKNRIGGLEVKVERQALQLQTDIHNHLLRRRLSD